MERPTKQNSDDKFSNLPDEIVLHILSHLHMRALAQLSIVSKRCRELCRESCISNPTLFVSSLHTRSEGSSQRGFYNFLDRLMALRCLHKVKTQRFCLQWFCETSVEDDENHVRTWLQHAVNSNVEDVYLELHPQKPFSLPPSILGCKSMRSLEINAYNLTIRLPSSLSVPSLANELRVLVLRALKINNESLGEWFSSFKSLRVLKLLEIRGIETMTITNSYVETLIITSRDNDLQKIDIHKLQKLHHLLIEWNGCSSCSKSMKISAPSLQSLSIIWDTYLSTRTSLEISAPNLQRFQWYGNTVDDYCMKNSPNLSYASVGLLPPIASWGNHASTKHSLEKVLHSIQRAKSLTLWDDFVEVLYMHGCLPFLFGNVEHLTVRGTSSNTLVKPLSSLLKGTTNLKHLILVGNPKPSEKLSFKRKFWQSRNLPFTRHLETVGVEHFDGENEVEQIKHVLKNEEELKKMVILSASPVSQGFVTEFRDFMTPPTELHVHLKSLERISADMRVVQLSFAW